jgi:hypothetical protein
MSCSVTYETPDGVTRESDLYKELEKKFVNKPGYADNIWDLIHTNTLDFEALYGKWKTNPEKFVKRNSETVKEPLYTFTDPATKEIVHGEPHIDMVMLWYNTLLKERYDFNTGRFELVGSASEAALLKIASHLEVLIDRLKRDRTQTKNRGKLRKNKDDLTTALKSESQKEAARGLLQYALNAINITSEIRKELQTIELDLDADILDPKDSAVTKKVQKIYEYLNGYNEASGLLEDVKLEIKQTNDRKAQAKTEAARKKIEEDRAKDITLITGGLTEIERNDLVESLEAIQNERKSIEVAYEKMAEDFVTAKFNMKEEEMIQWHTETFAKEYKKEFPKSKDQSQQEYDEAIAAYVNEKLEKTKSFIVGRSDSIFRNLLHSSNKDINMVHRWLLSAMNAPSPLLRSIQKEISVMEDNIRREWQRDVSDLDDDFKALLAYEKEQGNAEGDLQKFYDWMIDTNDKNEMTRYFVHRYTGTWQNEIEDARTSIFSDKSLTYNEKERKFEIWKHGIANDDVYVPGHLKLNFTVLGDNTDYSIEYNMLLDNARTSGEWGALTAFKDKMRQLHRQQNSLFEVPNSEAYSKERFEEFKSKKYEELMALPADNPRRVYYEKYMKIAAESDRLLPASFRLGFKMPSMRKSLAERFYDIELWKFFGTGTGSFYNELVKPWMQETVNYVPGTISERGEENFEATEKKIVAVDKDHKQRQFIPIYYRGKIETQDLTRDLHGSLLKNMYVSKAYTQMSAMLPYIEMILHFMSPKKHQTFQTEGGAQLFGKGAVGRLLQKDGANTYEAARDLIETRMYGITMIDPGWEFGPKGKKIKMIKLFSLMQSYISTTLLAGNYHSSMANANLGNTMNAIESVGGEFFNVKQLGSGYKSYLMDVNNQLRDLGETKDRFSTVNLFNEIFDPLNNFHHGKYSYAHNAKMANFMKNTSLHFLNNSVEHEVQSVTLLAYLKSIRVKDVDGSYITKKGEKTEDREKGMSLYDAYKKGDGRLTLDSKVYTVERRVGELYITENYASQGKEMIEWQTKKFSEEYKKESPKLKGQSQQEYDKALNAYVSEELEKTKDQQDIVNGKITLVIQKLNEELQGAYSIRNSAPAQRTMIGAGFYHLKKFFFPGYWRRFGGIGSVLVNYFPGIGLYAQGKLQEDTYIEGLGADRTRMYEPMTGTIRDLGTYSGTLKFFFKSISDLDRLKWQVLTENWSELSINQKASIKKTVTELALIMTLPLIAGAFKTAAEDDDEDNNYYTYSFLSYRLYSELVMYINPKEALRILQNPAVTVSFIERVINLMGQMGSDVWGLEMEQYKSGTRKGDYKVMKNFYDLVPFYKHATRHKLMADIINYYYRD